MNGTSLEATITIEAQPETVLTAFQAIERWSAWYPGVVNARWRRGEPWAVDAVMEVQVRNSLGMLVNSRAVVLPVQGTDQDARQGSPDPAQDLAIPDVRLCCWENRAPGLVTVCYAWAEPTDGGCRFTLQKNYRGALVPLLWLMKGRQARMLQQGLARLQSLVRSGVNKPTLLKL